MEEIQNQKGRLKKKFKDNFDRLKKKAYLVLTLLVVFVFLILIGQAVSPRITNSLLEIIWITAFVSTIIFFGIAVLVFIGLKKEAARILDILLEGSLSVIDVIDFIKEAYKTFIAILKEFVFYAAPIIAILCAFTVYYFILLIYKLVGKSYDVTFLTIIITSATILVAGVLNKPQETLLLTKSWIDLTLQKFKRVFTDSFEVVIALFFLTMDSTNLFFLPNSLNVKIEASIFGYDLTKRSLPLTDPGRIALTLIVISVFIEVIRYGIRIFATAQKYYYQLLDQSEDDRNKSEYLKKAIRKSFSEAKDDTLKFITFTSILLFVFLFFPRLKLLAVICASVTAFVLDLLIPERLTATRGEDLVSRLLSKVFKL